MELEESRAEARRLMLEAGWTPIPKPTVWNDDYTAGTLVGGVTPDGLTQYVKDWAQVKPGDPQYSSDTPDEPHEAAAWLIAQFRPNPLTTQATLDPVALQSEEVENTGDEGNGETGEASVHIVTADSDGNSADTGGDAGEIPGAGVGEEEWLDLHPEGGLERRDGWEREDNALDADFTEGQDLGSELLDVESELLAPELPAPDPEDFAPDEFQPEEDAGSAFIFGDNLGQRRTSAIGLIWQHAAQIMPAWGANDNQRLGELRNFAAGVAAGTFTNSDALQAELDALEISVRRINEIESARDSKIQFVNTATHEQLDAFDPAADWP